MDESKNKENQIYFKIIPPKIELKNIPLFKEVELQENLEIIEDFPVLQVN
jgi:hypothetical protein